MEHNITGSGEVIFPTDTNVSIMISMLNEENIFSISIAAVNIIGIGPYLYKNGKRSLSFRIAFYILYFFPVVIILISPTMSSIGLLDLDVYIVV